MLFRRYWRDAWRAAFAITGRRSLADDVAADGFERAFAALGRFDERQRWLVTDYVVAFATGDYRRLAEVMVEMGGVGSGVDLDSITWVVFAVAYGWLIPLVLSDTADPTRPRSGHRWSDETAGAHA